MKSFLVFGFTASFVLAWALDEPLLLPRRRIYKPPKTQVLNFRPNEDQKFEQIMYFKNLMELKCMRKIFNDTRSKSRTKYRKSYSLPKPSGSPLRSLQDKTFYLHGMRPNFISVEPHQKVYFGNNRIIFLPRGKLVEKQKKKFQQNKTSQPKSNEIILNNNKQTIAASSSPAEKRKNEEDIPKAIPRDSYPKPNQKLNNLKSKPLIYPVKNYHFPQRLKPIRPYDVTEIVNEELVFDSLGQQNIDSLNVFQFEENPFLGSFFLKKENGQKAQFIKPLIGDTGIEKNSSTILKALKGSGNSKKSKEILYHQPSQENLVTASEDYKNYKSDRISDFIKKTTQNEPAEVEFVNNSQTTAKLEKFTKKVTVTSTKALKVEKWSDSSENTQQTTAKPSTLSYSEFYDDDVDIYLLNATTKNQDFNIPILFPLNTSQTTMKNFTTQEIAVTEKENSSDVSVTLSLDQTTPTEQTTGEYLSTKFASSDLPDKTTENSDLLQDLGTVTENTSPPTFKEPIDRPLSIDLLSAMKKDQESILKSGRKMQFGEETLTTTLSNEISEHRRSDILIDENVDYYSLDDSFSSSNYMRKLKQMKSLNSSTNFLVQLIPVVIDDLREDKFSPEDILVLSKAFGKYWPAVLALSNNTNIDMLPLLKMKDEEDLNNTLRTFFSENFLEMPSETKETSHESYGEYDYGEEYENLGEYRDLVEKEETYKRDRREANGAQNLKHKYKYVFDTNADIPESSENVKLNKYIEF